MEEVQEVQCMYGSGNTVSTMFTVEIDNGSTWYAVKDSCNYNLCDSSELESPYIERYQDYDMFTGKEAVDEETFLAEVHDFLGITEEEEVSDEDLDYMSKVYELTGIDNVKKDDGDMAHFMGMIHNV